MAATVRDVKGGQTNSVGSALALVAFAVNPAAGDVVVVVVSSTDATNRAHSAPTDSAGGNTYTQIGTTTTFGNNSVSIWYSVLVNGGASFVVTLHSTGSVAGLSGVAWLTTGLSAYNADTAAQTTTAANPTSTTSAPAPPANSFFLGGMTNSGTGAVTDGSGWNTTGSNGVTAAMVTAARQTDNSSFQDCYSEYRISSSALAATWTEASDTYGARVASFAPPTPRSFLLGRH